MVMNDAYTIRYISFFLNTSCPKPVVGRDLFFCSFKQLKQDPFPPLVCSAKHTTTTQHMPFFNTSSLIFILEHYKNSWPAPLFFSSFLKMITKLQFAPPLASSSFPTSPHPVLVCSNELKMEQTTSLCALCPVVLCCFCTWPPCSWRPICRHTRLIIAKRCVWLLKKTPQLTV